CGRPPLHVFATNQAKSVLVEIPSQRVAGLRLAELAKGFRLDLANSLASDTEVASDLFQRPEPAILETVTKDNNPPLALRKPIKSIPDLGLEELLRGKLQRRRHRVVLDKITKERIAISADR